ncbi:MAG: CBS domain-containing protein, partial [Aliifodinibius sp.]|nr:CBS domain-containing protein [Fodinibius sp.]NIV10831.1 CBS domain-containing protein [Fodinibius sp.]NIY24429.1 CBS domain-containing protein [Fodinibius sp.]
MFPVVEKDNNGKLFGCVNIKQVKDVPRSEWSRRTVGELVNHCTADNTISVDSDATKALSIMHRTGNSRLMVTDNSHLVGVISLKDLMQFLSLKVDLEDVD